MGSSEGKRIPVRRYNVSQTRQAAVKRGEASASWHKNDNLVSFLSVFCWFAALAVSRGQCGCPLPRSRLRGALPHPSQHQSSPAPAPDAPLLLGLASRWFHGAAGLCSRVLWDVHMQLPVLHREFFERSLKG